MKFIYHILFDSLRIQSIHDHQHLRIFRSEEIFLKAHGRFSDNKVEPYDVIIEFPYLRIKSKKEMISFPDKFFQGIDGRNILVKKLLPDCLPI